MRYLACHETVSRGTFDFPIELYYVDASHPRYEMPFHWHMECEFLLVLEGAFSLLLDGEPLLLQKGDVAFVPSGVIHGGTPQQCIYECVVFDFERFLQDSAVCRRRIAAALGESARIHAHFSGSSQAGRLIDRLFEAMETECFGYEFTTTGLLWEWVGVVLAQHLYTELSEAEVRSSRRAEQMRDVLRRIRNDYVSPLTLAELSAEAGMAPQYFCRVFRQVTGRSPIDYLNYYRVECASELLCASADSVTDIALACGFGDLNYFIRTFRRHKAMSPTQFRRQHQK